MNKKNLLIKAVFGVVLLLFVVISLNVFSNSILKIHLRSGTKLNKYVESDNIVDNVISARRGFIYDRNGVVLAQDINSYDVICILDKNRISNNEEIAYVDEPQKTAKILSEVLNGSYEEILDLLSQENVYQTELGIVGRGISKEKKEEIEQYDLNGVEFRKSAKRNYPLDNFSPYILGFASKNEKEIIEGKMGVEAQFDSYLKGVDGHETFQADKDGFILPGMKEETIAAKNGANIYLTLDKGVQEAINIALSESVKQFNATDVWAAVVEVESGRVLGWGQYPSFSYVDMKIDDFKNKGTQYTYEPGSVFKSIIYAAAMDLGVYNGQQTFNSESYCYLSDENGNPYRSYGASYGCVDNALNYSWGNIPLDDGLIRSSNVATSTLLTDYVGVDNFYSYIDKFGFFKEVNTDGFQEEIGQHNYFWASEKLNMTFGQGISTTMLHMVQAYTALFGNGEMIKPYFVEKVIDDNTGETLYKHQKEVVSKPISEKTAKEIQSLMAKVVSADYGTGQGYAIDGVDIIAKTGTSEVALAEGGYDDKYEIASVMIGFPADKPKYMLYYATKAHYDWTPHYTNYPVTNLLKKITKILEINYKKQQASIVTTKIEKYQMPNLINVDINEASKKLNELNVDIVLIGNGKTIIKTLPIADGQIYSKQKVFLLTDLNDITIPDFTNYTVKDIQAFQFLTGIQIKINGQGLVYSQSIEKGSTIDNTKFIELNLKNIKVESEEEKIEVNQKESEDTNIETSN